MKITKLLGIIQQTIKLNSPLYWKCVDVSTDGEKVKIALVDLFAGNGWVVTLPCPGKYQDEEEEGIKMAFESLVLVLAI